MKYYLNLNEIQKDIYISDMVETGMVIIYKHKKYKHFIFSKKEINDSSYDIETVYHYPESANSENLKMIYRKLKIKKLKKLL